MSIGRKPRGGLSARQNPNKKYAKTSDRIRQAQGNQINHYTPQWAELKEIVKRLNNYTCCKCSVQVLPQNADFSDRVLTVDHKIPISRGGKTVLQNLWTLCDLCHEQKIGKANKRGSKLLRASSDRVRNQRHAKRTKS